ncbi:hypothetical protein Tco_1436095, partial [Tanacetum coccineum]
EINSLLDVQIQQDVPNIQQEPYYPIKVSVIPKTTQPPPSTLPAPPLPATEIQSTQVPNTKAVKSVVERFTALEQAVKELKQADHFAVVLASIKSQVPSVVKEYLGSSLPDAFQKVLQSHTEELKKERYEKRDYKGIIEESVQAHVINEVKNFLPKFLLQEVKESLKKTPHSLGQSSSQGQAVIQAAESLSEYELKKILYDKMHKSQSNMAHNTHQELFDALTWSMLLNKANMEKAGSNQGMKTKKRRVNESESSKKTSTTKESSKGKSLAKTSKSGKSVTTEEPVEEPVFEIASDDVEQTVDDENTVKTIDDTPEQPWFNDMIQAEKPPLMFDDLMSTPIDFSAYAINHLKLYKITREVLVGLVFNLLKGTCKSCVELEYNMEECYRALTNPLNWANPKGHKIPADMSKPLPLQDKEGRLVIPVEFFFNNDLEYLRAGNKERTYFSSITKTPAVRYTIEGIEDMIPTMWSLIVLAYDNDAALEISHWDHNVDNFTEL